MNGKKIIIDLTTDNMAEFWLAAEHTNVIGTTHMMVVHMARSRYMWES